jgi:hypothetical protein
MHELYTIQPPGHVVHMEQLYTTLKNSYMDINIGVPHVQRNKYCDIYLIT